jgi:predicted O-methyltransferase YrrM
MLNQEELESIGNTDMTYAREFVNNSHFHQMTVPKEHYKLMAFLSRRIDNQTIYDIGTYRGLSAIAMAANPTNKVISYDIENFVETGTPPNVEFRIGDCYQDAELLKSPLILLDVDPHDGLFEPKFVNWLVENNYKGTVVFDDIHLNEQMQLFWDNVTVEKYDLTDYGHYSGTGILVF